MKTKFISFFIFGFLILSCQNPKEKFIEKLTNNSEKFWDLKAVIVHKKKITLNSSKRVLYFHVNNEFREYYYERKYIYDRDEGSDVIKNHKWEYISSDSIKANGHNLKVYKLTQDSLILLEDFGFGNHITIYTKSILHFKNNIINKDIIPKDACLKSSL